MEAGLWRGKVVVERKERIRFEEVGSAPLYTYLGLRLTSFLECRYSGSYARRTHLPKARSVLFGNQHSHVLEASRARVEFDLGRQLEVTTFVRNRLESLCDLKF